MKLIFSEPVSIRTLTKFIAGGLKDRFNIIDSEKEALAEHPENKGNATARNTAKNYKIAITPGNSSISLPYQGIWYVLGGKALYLEGEPTAVLLQLPQNKSDSDINNFVGQGKIAQLKTIEHPIVTNN